MQIVVTFIATRDVLPSANTRQKASTVLVSHLFAHLASEDVRQNQFCIRLVVVWMVVHGFGTEYYYFNTSITNGQFKYAYKHGGTSRLGR